MARLPQLPPPPWRWGKKAEEPKEPRRLSPHCYNIASLVATAYEQAVQLEADMLHDRRVDAETRVANLDDAIALYGLTKFTTPEERERLVAGLKAVRSSLSDGTTIAHDAANRFTGLMREALFNIIVRCEC